MMFGIANFAALHIAMYASDEIMDDVDWSSDLMVS
jgi:hypothetical protein